MNLKLTNKNALAFLVLTAMYFSIVSASVFAGGKKETPPRLEWTLVRNELSVKPEWVNVVPQSSTEIFFVGISQILDTQANARNNAHEDARIQVLKYYGQVLEHRSDITSVISESMWEIVSLYIDSEEATRTFAQSVVSEVATVAYYTETYVNNTSKKEGYIVYALHRISRQKAEAEISAFAKKIREHYTPVFAIDKIIPIPATKSINIEARFNSSTRTYRHRDELGLTVKADKDCYFKVIHIDVNNQMKMIYPNTYDQNNRLFANTPRTLFERAKYYLYDPYGTEIILLVASKEQFRNIENEYISPWVAATIETIRSAIRGGDLELAGTDTLKHICKSL